MEQSNSSAESKQEEEIEIEVDEGEDDTVLDKRVVEILMRANRVPQRTDEWYKRRRIMLTASDAASILGVNPYQSRKTVFNRKIGKIKPFKGNPATRHGQDNEGLALDKYEDVTGNTLVREDIGLLSHLKHPKIGGSPDGITANGILIEVKCPYKRMIVPGTIPAMYVPQVQLLLEICDLEIAHFVQYRPASWFRDEQLEIVEVRRDRQWFANALPQLLHFVDELEQYYVSQKLPIGTPVKDWDEEDNKQYTQRPQRKQKACQILEDEAEPSYKRLRLTITSEEGEVTSHEYKVDESNGVRIEFNLSDLPPKLPTAYQVSISSPAPTEIQFDAQAQDPSAS